MLEQTNEMKVLKIFFDNPSSRFHIRELARKLKLNPNTILNITNNLCKKDLLVKEKKKYLVEIYVNRTNLFKTLKRLDNLKRLFFSGLIKLLSEEFNPELISVIGSYSLGEDLEESDIDLVVISNKEKSLSLEKFEKNLNRKIHLIVTDYSSISDEFYINLINGVLLQGYIKKK